MSVVPASQDDKVMNFQMILINHPCLIKSHYSFSEMNLKHIKSKNKTKQNKNLNFFMSLDSGTATVCGTVLKSPL